MRPGRTVTARKTWKQLKRENVAVAHCTVRRLMRQMGLCGLTRGKAFKITTISDAKVHRPADLVERKFVATRPNQLWVADAAGDRNGWEPPGGGREHAARTRCMRVGGGTDNPRSDKRGGRASGRRGRALEHSADHAAAKRRTLGRRPSAHKPLGVMFECPPSSVHSDQQRHRTQRPHYAARHAACARPPTTRPARGVTGDPTRFHLGHNRPH